VIAEEFECVSHVYIGQVSLDIVSNAEINLPLTKIHKRGILEDSPPRTQQEKGRIGSRTVFKYLYGMLKYI
jgi:hypothetical protein